MSFLSLKRITLLYKVCISLCILSFCYGCGQKNNDKEALDEKKSLERVLYVQYLYNMNPGGEIIPQIKSIVDSMRQDGRNPYYYAAVNVLIDRLFAKGRFTEADSLAVQIEDEAREDNDSISIAMAHRVRAQMFYKLFLAKRALAELSPAPHYISSPYESGYNFGTATSVQEWLWIISRDLNDTVAMERAGIEYSKMVEENLKRNNFTDTTGHYLATAYAFKAANNLVNKQFKEAYLHLDSASKLIKPTLPSRAYEHFYDVRSDYRLQTKDFSGAIEDIDTLLSTHKDFPRFYLRDLLLKSKILEEEKRFPESSEVLKDYITFHDSIITSINTRRLKDLTVLHKAEVEREQLKSRRARILAWGSLTLVLLILLITTLYMTLKEKRINRLLVERLNELDHSKEKSTQTLLSAEVKEPLSQIEILDRHMLLDRPYTDPALGRKELAEYLGISPDAIGLLIKKERGMSVKSYITFFRLEESRKILGSDSSETINEIALRLGFGTARTMQRVFKETYAMSPTQYRNTAKEIISTDNQ